jgi:polyhydroxyalkanoate synthase
MFPFKSLQTIQEQIKIRLKYGPEFIGDLNKIAVGCSEKTLVLKNGSHSLYYYRGKKEKNQPLLFIYSLINRPYIFDLRPGRSLIEYLCEQGYDVYLIDWGNPGPEAAFLTLEDIITGTVDRFVKWILRKHEIKNLDIAGYCMGGTFATMYAGYQPQLVNKLILLTPPLGVDEGGLLQKIAGKINWKNKISISGIIPGRLLKLFFNSIRPAISLKKERDFWLNYDKENYLENFLPVEKWSNDTPDIPGQVFFEFLDICFSGDQMKTGKIKLGNTGIDFSKVSCPVLSVSAEHDWIIPAASLETVKKVLPNAEHQSLLIKGGHIGLVVGRTATTVREEINTFLN